jgi:hypothetical protein
MPTHSSLVTSLFELLLVLTTGCLPIPNRVRDTPELRGELTVDGKALAGADVIVEPVKYDVSAPPIACGAGGHSVRTDSSGAFTAAAQRHWEAWISFVGESPDWHRHWRICTFAARPGEPAEWQLLWDGRTNLGTPLLLDCDIASPWKTDTLAGWSGRCRPPTAAGR